MLFVPGSMLTLGAGFLFGVVRGTIAVSVGSVLGATAAFLIGRTLLRGWIEKRIAAYPRFQAIDRAVGTEGFKIVLLVRLSPGLPVQPAQLRLRADQRPAVAICPGILDRNAAGDVDVRVSGLGAQEPCRRGSRRTQGRDTADPLLRARAWS